MLKGIGGALAGMAIGAAVQGAIMLIDYAVHESEIHLSKMQNYEQETANDRSGSGKLSGAV
jgi:hypothetical protein